MIADGVSGTGANRTSQARLLRNLGWLIGAQLTTWLLSLAWTIIVPRLIGPSGMGLVVMFLSTSGILAAIAGLGSRPLLIREVAQNPQSAATLMATALLIRMALLVPCAGLTYAYIRLGHFHGVQALILWLGAALAAVTLLTEAIVAGLQGLERMDLSAKADVLTKATFSILGIPTAVLGLGALGITIANILGSTAVLGLAFRWGRLQGISLRKGISDVGSFAARSLSFWAAALFFTFYLWVDSAMLAVLAPASVVGWYGVATRVFQTLMFLPVIVSTAWLPRLSTAHKVSVNDLRLTARSPVALVMTMSLPVAVGTALVATPVIDALYGNAFLPAGPVLAILGLTCVPMYAGIILNQLLVASGRQAKWTLAMILASLVNPALNAWLIPRFQTVAGNGAIGAALSLLGTELLILLLGAYLVRDLLDRALAARLARAAVATVGMAVIALAASRVNLSIEILTALVAFGALAFAMRALTPDEVGSLISILRRRGK